jgi:solute carrier family 25 carnitine/acylcarnitine transporter 20/29
MSDSASTSEAEFSNASKQAKKSTVDPIKSFLSGGAGGISAVLVGAFECGRGVRMGT